MLGKVIPAVGSKCGTGTMATSVQVAVCRCPVELCWQSNCVFFELMGFNLISDHQGSSQTHGLDLVIF